jgi:beta-glucuronidase
MLCLLLATELAPAQDFITNIQGRNTISLNGKWNALVDPTDAGISDWSGVWKDRTATGKTDFYEYGFEGGPVLDVPGDFNSQLPGLANYESSVWYKKIIPYHKTGKRVFIYFGAVNYKCDVFLNGRKIGSHEGGFTPFQFELTDKINEGSNSLLVRANNERQRDGVPARGFDWFNYGGITREVYLLEMPEHFIEDYFIQLKKGTTNEIEGWVKINGGAAGQTVRVQVPEAAIDYKTSTNDAGYAPVKFTAKLALWSPEQPKLYHVIISTDADKTEEAIGFRSIEVKGTDILLNGKPVFLKGVDMHDENPQRKARAWSSSDALQLLTWVKELGCNFVRLAHYPHNEYTVRLADKMGIMLWEEIPVYQGIAFSDPVMQEKMNYMLREMLRRDKNRCATILWSMSNETVPGPDRDRTIANMAALCRSLDPTRLVTSAFDHIKYQNNTVTIDDTLGNALDVLAVNEYLGWYRPWPAAPENMVWKSAFNKPLIMSEFGAEALYGNHGTADTASHWNEEYQEKVFKDQTAMFKNIPFLRGTTPWILVDFRSPTRMHPVYQQGWNRKGLLSDQGFKKKAWYIIKQFYDTMPR